MKPVIYLRGAVVAAKSLSIIVLIAVLRLEENLWDTSSVVLLVLTFAESIKRLICFGMPNLFMNSFKLCKSSSYLYLMRRTGFRGYSIIHLSVACLFPLIVLFASGRVPNTPLHFVVLGCALLMLLDVSFACHVLALKAKFTGKTNLSMILSDLWIIVSVLFGAIFMKVGNLFCLTQDYSASFVFIISSIIAALGFRLTLFLDKPLYSRLCEDWLYVKFSDPVSLDAGSIFSGMSNYFVTESLKWAPYLAAFFLLSEEDSLSINLATRIAALVLIPLVAVNIKNTHLYAHYLREERLEALSELMTKEVLYIRKLLLPTLSLGILAYLFSISFLSVSVAIHESIIVTLIFLSAAFNAYTGPTSVVLGLRFDSFKKTTLDLVFIGLAFLIASVAALVALRIMSSRGLNIDVSIYPYFVAGLSLICTIIYQIKQKILLKRLMYSSQ